MQTKRQLQSDKARQKIIDASLELFASKGYLPTSVDSIAAEAGVSKGLIYYYFKSKEEILKGIFHSLIAESEKLFKDKEKLSPRQFIKLLSDYSFGFITQQPKLFRLVLALTVQPEVIKELKNELEYVRRVWMEEMKKAFESLGYEHPESEVYLLCAIFDGAGLASAAMQDYPISDIQALVEKKYGLREK